MRPMTVVERIHDLHAWDHLRSALTTGPRRCYTWRAGRVDGDLNTSDVTTRARGGPCCAGRRPRRRPGHPDGGRARPGRVDVHRPPAHRRRRATGLPRPRHHAVRHHWVRAGRHRRGDRHRHRDRPDAGHPASSGVVPRAAPGAGGGHGRRQDRPPPRHARVDLVAGCWTAGSGPAASKNGAPTTPVRAASAPAGPSLDRGRPAAPFRACVVAAVVHVHGGEVACPAVLAGGPSRCGCRWPAGGRSNSLHTSRSPPQRTRDGGTVVPCPQPPAAPTARPGPRSDALPETATAGAEPRERLPFPGRASSCVRLPRGIA